LVESSAMALTTTMENFATSADAIEIGNPTRLRCSYSTSLNFFLAEAYSFFLLLLSLLLSSMNRNIKRNYSEAKWLFAASLTCTLVMSAWIFLQAFVSPTYIDLLTVAELYVVGAVLLGMLFGPKLYVLLSYESVVVECANEGMDTGAGSLDSLRNKKKGQYVPGAMHNQPPRYDLFETDWMPERGHGSTIHGGRSGTLSPSDYPLQRTTSPSEMSLQSRNSSPIDDDHLRPSGSMFTTVLRKKTRNPAHNVRRSRSESSDSHITAHHANPSASPKDNQSCAKSPGSSSKY